jgi:hypothetical protein
MPGKKCSKCEASFECGSDKMGCWCEDLFIDLETLNKLKSEFNNCLCPKCLKEYSLKDIKN